jgi:hypothetical protein
MAAITGLLVLFLFVLGYALLNGLNVECGCFSAGEPGPEGLRMAFIRDVVMIAGVFCIYWFSEKTMIIKIRSNDQVEEDTR